MAASELSRRRSSSSAADSPDGDGEGQGAEVPDMTTEGPPPPPPPPPRDGDSSDCGACVAGKEWNSGRPAGVMHFLMLERMPVMEPGLVFLFAPLESCQER